MKAQVVRKGAFTFKTILISKSKDGSFWIESSPEQLAKAKPFEDEYIIRSEKGIRAYSVGTAIYIDEIFIGNVIGNPAELDPERDASMIIAAAKATVMFRKNKKKS